MFQGRLKYILHLKLLRSGSVAQICFTGACRTSFTRKIEHCSIRLIGLNQVFVQEDVVSSFIAYGLKRQVQKSPSVAALSDCIILIRTCLYRRKTQ